MCHGLHVPWEPLPDQSSEPGKLDESLDRLMGRLGGTSTSVLETIMNSWADVVGDVAAEATAPVKLKDGVLTVRADDPAWTTELAWSEPQIIERIRSLAGGTGLRAVKVVSRAR